MKSVTGDIWEVPCDCVCIPTNGVVAGGELVMGAGLALQAKKRFPHLPGELGKLVNLYGNLPFYFRHWGVASFPTKRHFRERSSLTLLENSAREMVWIADRERLKEIVLPRVGCGLGGLDWRDVEPLLDRYLDSRFTVVHAQLDVPPPEGV